MKEIRSLGTGRGGGLDYNDGKMFARDVDSRKRKATSSPPDESRTVSASAKIPSLVMESERFRWIKKNKSGERIERIPLLNGLIPLGSKKW